MDFLMSPVGIIVVGWCFLAGLVAFSRAINYAMSMERAVLNTIPYSPRLTGYAGRLTRQRKALVLLLALYLVAWITAVLHLF
jgi:hypothetical protein